MILKAACGSPRVFPIFDAPFFGIYFAPFSFVVLRPGMRYDARNHSMRNRIQSLPARLRAWARGRKGQTLVEYALVLAVLSIISIAVFALLSNSIEGIFCRIASILDTAQSSH
jgi:Flp pilus assembly pilin Flp